MVFVFLDPGYKLLNQRSGLDTRETLFRPFVGSYSLPGFRLAHDASPQLSMASSVGNPETGSPPTSGNVFVRIGNYMQYMEDIAVPPIADSVDETTCNFEIIHNPVLHGIRMMNPSDDLLNNLLRQVACELVSTRNIAYRHASTFKTIAEGHGLQSSGLSPSRPNLTNRQNTEAPHPTAPDQYNSPVPTPSSSQFSTSESEPRPPINFAPAGPAPTGRHQSLQRSHNPPYPSQLRYPTLGTSDPLRTVAPQRFDCTDQQQSNPVRSSRAVSKSAPSASIPVAPVNAYAQEIQQQREMTFRRTSQPAIPAAGVGQANDGRYQWSSAGAQFVSNDWQMSEQGGTQSWYPSTGEIGGSETTQWAGQTYVAGTGY
jgi:hypothetical protein